MKGSGQLSQYYNHQTQQQKDSQKKSSDQNQLSNEKQTGFLEERMLDYDMLKRENQILKQENKLLRGEIIKRTEKMEQNELLQLLEFQRMRIDNLEREYDNLLQNSDNSYKSSKGSHINNQNQQNKSQTKDVFKLQQQLEQSERKCQILQEQIENVTQTYARQLAQLKAKMTEQGAQLLITAESNMPILTTPGMHNKTGALKKKTAQSGPRLDPLENASTLRQSTQSNSSMNIGGSSQVQFNQQYSSNGMNNPLLASGLQNSNPYQNYPMTQQYQSTNSLQNSVNYNRTQIPGQNSNNVTQGYYNNAQNTFLNQFKMQ